MHADEHGLAEVAARRQDYTIKLCLEQIRRRYHSNLGSATLKITYRGRSTLTDFKIVNVPNSPSILGCKQALEFVLITLNVNSLNVKPRQTATKIELATIGTLTRSAVLKSYGAALTKSASCNTCDSCSTYCSSTHHAALKSRTRQDPGQRDHQSLNQLIGLTLLLSTSRTHPMKRRSQGSQ